MIADGACGCWDIDVTMFGVGVDVKLGCFNFGNGCGHVTPCGIYSSCETCHSNQNCGWCTSSGLCIQGNQFAPNSGTCNSGWSFDHC